MMRRLHSAPKPSPRVLRYISDSVSRLGRAERVAHAVVARQIGAGFGRRDDVVARDRVVGRRQADLPHLAAELLQTARRRVAIRSPVSLVKSFRYSRGQSELQPFYVAVEQRGIIRHRSIGRRGIARIAPGDHAEQRGRVLHAAGERSDVIERTGEGRQPVARNAAVGRRHAHHAAERRRLPDRAAGVASRATPRPFPAPPPPPIRRSILPARDRAPPDCAPGRTPSSRSTIPWRTRRSWSCR